MKNTEHATIPDSTDRIGVFGDVHADYQKIISMLDQAEDVDFWFCLGDATDMFAPLHCNQPTIRILNKFQIPMVVGNHEQALMRSQQIHGFESACREYLARCPMSISIDFAGSSVALFHSTPKSLERVVDSRSGVATLRTEYEDVDADTIIIGHSHECFERSFDGRRLVSPGPLGDRRKRASYATLDRNGTISFESLIDQPAH